ncbi:MAG: efflux RND transporter periplasmic adaptor subunit [Lawsonibacter sp.]|nr:efflux RND transporter periplasmic adaptor subunit [Lawsonibacter sp.]
MEATQIKERGTGEQVPGKQETGRGRVPKLKLSKKRKKWFPALAVLLAASLAAGWFFLRPDRSAGGTEAGQYRLDTVQRRDLTASVDGAGTIRAIESYQVDALVTGEVLEAPLEVGDWVEKGELLYRIDAGEAEVGLQQAQLSLRQAQLSYDQLAAGQKVTASAAGVVQQVYVREGDLVSPGSPIAEVADASVMTLTLPFQSADAAGLAPGQSAQVTIAGTLETLPGTVESVASADLVGAGGALVRPVKLRVSNPGALTEETSATAVVGETACAGSGSFEACSRQTVVAQTSGQVTDVPVTAGSRVSAGTPLATLGGSALKDSLESAAISVENAQLTCQRARDALESYTIIAPISGTVIEKNVKAGDKVDGINSGSLAVIYDLSCLTLTMNVNELDIGKIQPGQQVELTAAALPGQTFRGVVDRVSINGTTTNGFTTYPATILLEEYGALKPGMNVSATIQGDTAAGVLTVPVEAVSRGDKVLVAPKEALAEDGTLADPSKLEERTVTLGLSDDHYIEITSGLAEGDTIAYQDTGTGAPAGG